MRITRRRGTPNSRRRSSPPGAEPELLELPLPGAAAEGADPPARASDVGAVRRRGGRSGWLWLVVVLAFPIGALAGFLLRQDPPVAVLSTDLLDFGEVELGATGELAVQVTNQGERPLRPTAASLAGEAAEEFRLTTDGCAGAEVPAQAGCAVRLIFAPVVRGARRARLTLGGNSVSGPQTVPLVGVGVEAELAVEPAELDFGLGAVGTAGQRANLRLENRGTAPLRLGQIRLEGPAAHDFRRLADDCSRRQLEPRGRCGVTYAFSPAAAGERRATVRIDHDAGEGSAAVPLIGRAVTLRPLLRLDPERVDFGSPRLTDGVPARAVTLANDGDASLRVHAVRLSEARGPFELLAEPCVGAELPPGGSCAIEVRFSPRKEASSTAFLEIDSNAAETPRRLPLAGTGTAPRLSVTPARLAFGEVAVGTSNAVRTLLLGSAGSAPATVESIDVAGADAGSFAAGGCIGEVLEPGSECAVEVRFTPQRPGPHRAELRLRHDAAGAGRRLSVNGLGVAADLSLDRARIDFGEVPAGREVRRSLTLTSSGRSPLVVGRLRLTGDRASGFEVVSDRCSGATLPPSASCTLSILFSTEAPGVRRIELLIDHSAAVRPREVPITATAF